MGVPHTGDIVERSDPGSDGYLAARIAAGDEGAFLEVYELHVDALFGVATRLLGDREAATEIVQESFLALWQRATLYDPRAGSLRGWLMRIARNRTIDRLRADARRPRLATPIRPPVEAEGAPEPWSPVDHEPDDPEHSFEVRWMRAVVRTALTLMPDDERVVLALAYDEGLSQSEIATRLAIPIGTVKSRTRRALARLRDMLASVPDLTGAQTSQGPHGSR